MLIACQNLSLGYDGRAIVDNLSFTVNEGDYLCIVGENGAGKSTLMRTLLGLQPPLGGSIMTDDGLTLRKIGYLPQQTEAQSDFPATVREIVLSGFVGRMGLRPFFTKEEKLRAEENIARMGISELHDRPFNSLSGGQRQRVLLARALCAAEKILLLDEPVAGLDPKVTMELYELIESLNREGVTIIMISHDLASAVRYASHILHIGSESFFGTREEYIERGGAENG